MSYGRMWRHKQTADAASILAECPYCLATKGQPCRPKYAGERLVLFAHISRLRLAKKIAESPATHSFEEAFAEDS